MEVIWRDVNAFESCPSHMLVFPQSVSHRTTVQFRPQCIFDLNEKLEHHRITSMTSWIPDYEAPPCL